ncbi:glycoside hydrolase family 43 protein [Lacisediminihabitans changchengi]|uniref:Glycoside hydrolase family 43 protein n=1 Tax=Lacisediminihabitans changchengi TaxID=2787634 RepID=A0A934W4U8_9MICO|nr:glycoside hydrolase family 43 protein [Lacisediminihabitans changchengi]MBK4348649.1 glycoside hydrolase family 43 protein [Lacisediminihabitans changchengi]
MAYFAPETEAEGEQIRFAVSDVDDPERWTPLNDGHPILVSQLGERGVRDPFLLRVPDSGEVILVATDLSIYPDQDWDRAVRHGSRSVVIWRTFDLVEWSGPEIVEVSPATFGNTWAPKAYWSEPRQAWLLIWASADYSTSENRDAERHQALFAAETKDFRTFGPAFVYSDPGHTVIDASFIQHNGRWYRFSANSLGSTAPGRGEHILVEVGDALESATFVPLVIDLGKPELVHAEGPAPFVGPDNASWYVLIDENGLRGYQLYRTTDLDSGIWEHRQEAQLPPDARHGSVLRISMAEREQLLSQSDHARTAAPATTARR